MTIHEPDQLITDADVALRFLKEGNRRFVDAELDIQGDFSYQRAVTADDGQKPFAVIVCCSDSRVSPEIFFDQYLGDIFVIRNAGNIVDDVALGSIEYAVDHLGSPLVVVCGHSGCGAVTAAHAGGEFSDNLNSIIKSIQYSIGGCTDLDDAIYKNVRNMTEVVKNDSVIAKLSPMVVGASYNIHTGEVSWL